MKGIMVKDLVSLRKKLGIILGFMVPLTISEVLIPMLVVAVTGYFSLLLFTIMANDESCHWNRLAAAMPIERKEFMASKYIIICGMVLITTVLMILIAGLRVILYDITGFYLFNMLNSWKFILLNIPIGFFLPTFILPIWAKFGYNKAGLAVGIIVFPMMLATGRMVRNEKFMDVLLGFLTSYSIPIILVSIVLFAVSWIISMNFIEKRDF